MLNRDADESPDDDQAIGHIAPGERYAVDVLGSTRVRTLSKEFTFPSLDENDMPFINDSPIVQPDVPACNGVVHVIGGAVLLP